MKSATIVVRCEPALKLLLEQEAEVQHITLAEVARNAIRGYFSSRGVLTQITPGDYSRLYPQLVREGEGQ